VAIAFASIIATVIAIASSHLRAAWRGGSRARLAGKLARSAGPENAGAGKRGATGTAVGIRAHDQFACGGSTSRDRPSACHFITAVRGFGAGPARSAARFAARFAARRSTAAICACCAANARRRADASDGVIIGAGPAGQAARQCGPGRP
jgi:hypothetical protein